jgi:hypothetical protein
MIHPIYGINVDLFLVDYPNLSSKDLQTKYNISKWKYDKLVKELNLPKKTNSKLEDLLTVQQLEDIEIKYKANVPFVQIARDYNTSDVVIRNYLKRIGHSFKTKDQVFKVTDIDIESFTEDYLSDEYQIDELLDKYNLTKWKYLRVVDELKLEKKKQKLEKIITEDIQQRIIQDAESGTNVAVLSDKYKIDWSVMSAFLQRHNIQPKNGSVKYNIDINKIIDMYVNQKKHLTEIAEEIGCTYANIRHHLERNNVEFRSQSEVMALTIEKGNHQSGYHHNYPTYLSKSGKQYKFRSGWEVTVAQYLDEQNLIWDYEIQSFNLGEFYYVPDFFIFKESGELDYIIEVKGWVREKDLRKLALMEVLYPEITLLFWDKEIYREIEKEVA